MLFSSPAFDRFLHTSRNKLTEETAHFKRGEETVRVSQRVCCLTGHPATRGLKTTIFGTEVRLSFCGGQFKLNPARLPHLSPHSIICLVFPHTSQGDWENWGEQLG